MKKSRLLREEAIKELSKYGIAGTQVYLIDILPLIEMIWADGKAQGAEVKVLDDYLESHVHYINKMAGLEVLSIEDARKFVSRFMKSRPSPELLKTLRSLVSPVRLSTSDEARKNLFKKTLLAACLDIALSSVTTDPDGINELFDMNEKRCFFEILNDLEQKGDTGDVTPPRL